MRIIVLNDKDLKYYKSHKNVVTKCIANGQDARYGDENDMLENAEKCIDSLRTMVRILEGYVQTEPNK